MKKCDKIHICTTKTELSGTEAGNLLNLLSPDEISNFLSIKDEYQRCIYLQSHAFKRIILSNHLKMLPSEIEFYTNPFGKPFIIKKNGKENCFFNLSHTSGMVAIIISSFPYTGIDVEKIVNRNDLDLLEVIIIQSDDIKEQTALQPEERKHNFYKKWVLKECYLKAIGMGFNVDPSSIKIDQKSDNSFFIIDENNPTKQNNILGYLQVGDFAIAYTQNEQIPPEIFNYSFNQQFRMIGTH